jgi:hypothetical protein
MKTEHTPGPWKLESGETYTVRAADEGGLCQLKWLRGRHGLGGRRPDEEVYANALLIAAAPELLAAATKLEEAETFHANCEECNPEDAPEICEKCFPHFDDARCMRRAALKAAGIDGEG